MATTRTTDPAETRTAPGQTAAPRPRRLRCALKTLRNVRQELATLYRQAKHGVIDVTDASKLANMLSVLARIIELTELESRVTALERQDGKYGQR